MPIAMKTVLIASGVLVGLYLLACALLAFNARGMLYHPVARDASVPHWVLQRHDAALVVSHNGRTSTQRVLYFGGNAEDASQALPMLEQAFPDAAIHALHYRGYGGSSGTPSEKRLVADALALYDAVADGAQELTLVGRSLGSGVAVQVAAARPGRRLVLITPYHSVAGLAADMYPMFPVRWLLHDHYDSWRFAGRISTPATLIVAGRDKVIPPASSYRLLRHFRPGVAQAVTLAEADHNDVFGHPGFMAALRGR